MINYVAQLLSIVGCILLTVSCKQNTQKKVMIFQCCECVITILSTILLGGITGAIVTFTALLRNIIAAFDKSTKTSTGILVSISIIMSIITAKSFIDILPAIAGVEYTLALYKNNVKTTKMAFAMSAFLWILYDITIGAWVYITFNIVNIVICLYEVHKLNGSSTD